MDSGDLAKEDPEDEKKRKADLQRALKRERARKRRAQMSEEEKRLETEKTMWRRRIHEDDPLVTPEKLLELKEKYGMDVEKLRKNVNPENRKIRLQKLIDAKKSKSEDMKARERFRCLEKRLLMTEEEKEQHKMKQYLYMQAYYAKHGRYSEKLREEKGRENTRQKKWRDELTPEGKQQDSLRKSQKKHKENVKAKPLKPWPSKKVYWDRMKSEEPERWMKHRDEWNERQRKKYQEETEEERKKRRYRERVNGVKRRLKKKLEEEGVEAGEIEKRLKEVHEKMWKEFDPEWTWEKYGKHGVRKQKLVETPADFPSEPSTPNTLPSECDTPDTPDTPSVPLVLNVQESMPDSHIILIIDPSLSAHDIIIVTETLESLVQPATTTQHDPQLLENRLDPMTDYQLLPVVDNLNGHFEASLNFEGHNMESNAMESVCLSPLLPSISTDISTMNTTFQETLQTQTFETPPKIDNLVPSVSNDSSSSLERVHDEVPLNSDDQNLEPDTMDGFCQLPILPPSSQDPIEDTSFQETLSLSAHDSFPVAATFTSIQTESPPNMEICTTESQTWSLQDTLNNRPEPLLENVQLNFEDHEMELDGIDSALPSPSTLLPPPPPSSDPVENTSFPITSSLPTQDLSPVETELRCKFCTVEFVEDCDLRDHMRASHPDKVWKCPICKAVVLSPQELSSHFQSVHKAPSKPETQDVPESAKLETTSKNHSKLNFFCMRCPVKDEVVGFSTRLELFSHVKKKHKRQSFWPCDRCSILKYSSQALQVHQTICTVSKNLVQTPKGVH